MAAAATTPTLFTIEHAPDEDYASCQGQFSFEEGAGYTGHLFLSDYRPKPNDVWSFALPPELSGPIWRVRLEDGNHATICFPRVAQRSWTNMSALRVHFSFSYLIEQVGIGRDDEEVVGAHVDCVSLSSIVGIRPVTHSFNWHLHTGTAEFTVTDKHVWTSDDFLVEIGAQRGVGASTDASEVHFRSHLVLGMRYIAPKNALDALNDIRMFEDLLSILAGRYVALRQAGIDISLQRSTEDELKPETFAVRGHGAGQETADYVQPYEVLVSFGLDRNWGDLVAKFRVLREQHEIAFKWFRSSQINRRYLEEQFSYAVRLTELYFRGEREDDPHARAMISTILARSNDDDDLIDFVNRRMLPMFRGTPSLVGTLRRLFETFPEVAAFTDIPPQRVNYLRGKEMHGGASNYTSAEYADMHRITASLMLTFRLSVMEACGLTRSELGRVDKED